MSSHQHEPGGEGNIREIQNSEMEDLEAKRYELADSEVLMVASIWEPTEWVQSNDYEDLLEMR